MVLSGPHGGSLLEHRPFAVCLPAPRLRCSALKRGQRAGAEVKLCFRNKIQTVLQTLQARMLKRHPVIPAEGKAAFFVLETVLEDRHPHF